MLAVGVSLLATACGASTAEKPRLVLLYAPCTVSTRFLAPYAAEVPFTPRLERFAREAMVAERHRTEAGSSGIAYAALFSGNQADRHGVFRHPASLSEDLRLIAEYYADAGYETWYWNGHGMATQELNYAQGVPAANVLSYGLSGSDPDFVRLLDRLREDPDRRALVITNSTVTHGPYDGRPLERFLRRHPELAEGLEPELLSHFQTLYQGNVLALAYNTEETLKRLSLSDSLPDFARAMEIFYAANVEELDRIFGAVLDAIEARGLLADSLIAFTADHGESMYRPGAPFQWTHSALLAPEVLDVPLIIRRPGELRPGRFGGVTRSIDLLPTLLALSGIRPPTDGIEGRDLSRVLWGEEPDPGLTAFSHTGMTPRSVHQRMRGKAGRATWGHRMKLFPRPDVRLAWVTALRRDRVFALRKHDGVNWRVEVFDRANDPDETRDLFDARDPDHQAMAASLERYKERLIAAAGTTTAQPPPPADEEEALRALGYIQ